MVKRKSFTKGLTFPDRECIMVRYGLQSNNIQEYLRQQNPQNYVCGFVEQVRKFIVWYVYDGGQKGWN